MTIKELESKKMDLKKHDAGAGLQDCAGSSGCKPSGSSADRFFSIDFDKERVQVIGYVEAGLFKYTDVRDTRRYIYDKLISRKFHVCSTAAGWSRMSVFWNCATTMEFPAGSKTTSDSDGRGNSLAESEAGPMY